MNRTDDDHLNHHHRHQLPITNHQSLSLCLAELGARKSSIGPHFAAQFRPLLILGRRFWRPLWLAASSNCATLTSRRLSLAHV